MIHLTEEMILAVRDREPVADEVLAHIDECGACARALEDARSRAEAVEKALAVLTAPLGKEVRVERVSRRGQLRGLQDSDAGRVAAEVAAGSGLQDSNAGPVGADAAAGLGRPEAPAGIGARVVPIGRGRRDAVRGTRVRAGLSGRCAGLAVRPCWCSSARGRSPRFPARSTGGSRESFSRWVGRWPRRPPLHLSRCPARSAGRMEVA